MPRFTPLRQMLPVAGLTVLQGLRTPAFVLLAATGVTLQLLNPLLVIHPFGDPLKLPRDAALALHALFGLLALAVASGSVLRREIADDTAAVTLSKPVSRTVYFLAKYCGILACVWVFTACAACGALLNQLLAGAGEGRSYWMTLLPLLPVAALALAAPLHARGRRPYGMYGVGMLLLLLTGAVATVATAGFTLAWELLPATVLVGMLLSILAALSLALAVGLDTGANLVVCVVALAVGLVAHPLLATLETTPGLRAAMACLLPDWQHFWVAEALQTHGRIATAYLLHAGAYAAGWIGVALTLGWYRFHAIDLA